MGNHVKLQGESVDNMEERLGGIVKLFCCCHVMKESVMRLRVLEDMFSGDTGELLHDIAMMLDNFDKEIERE